MKRRNSKAETGVATYSEGSEEEQSVDQDTPDGDVGEDASSQAGSIKRNSTVPVQRNESPGQWSGDDWEMDKAWGGWVAEVERRQVEEVDDQDDLGPDEVGAHEEHDEGKLKEVVEDEVGADGGGGIDVVGVAGEEVPDVSNLEGEENNPGSLLVFCCIVGGKTSMWIRTSR